MSERRVARHWVIQVNGAVLARVEPGNGVEIGRKPIRPLVSDGFTRIEIADETRSMSKRHALFTVNAKGEAGIRDLNSTNGSFAVDTTGKLTRLPEGADFPVTDSSVRIQFGDVPVDFICVDPSTQEKPAPAVSDLFGGSSQPPEGKQEPDPARMSVDEILNLRAGEPTSVFDAENIQRHIRLRAADDLPIIPALNDSGAADDSNETRTGNSDEAGESGQTAAESAPEHTARDVPSDEMTLNVIQPGMQAEPKPRDLFADAQADVYEVESGVRQESEESQELVGRRQPEIRSAASMQPDEQQVSPGSEEEREPQPGQGFEIRSRPETNQQANPQTPHEPDATRRVGGEDAASEHVVPDGNAAVALDAQEPRFAEAAAFKPAFEPGSVFERVSKGEFENSEASVEVEGFTSDEAKRNNDFTLQFEMARYPQLLPFLAMNPALYDDLYAWLAAQGNEDIDAALSRNEGYAEYLAHIGKRTE